MKPGLDGDIFSADAATVLLPEGAPLVIANPAHLFQAGFERDGSDLWLRNETGPDIRIEGYFKSDAPQDIAASNGAVLSGDVVHRLAGPEAPGQYAFFHEAAGATATDGSPDTPIGQVERIEGAAFVRRTDGTEEALRPGTPVFANDVVRTGDSGTLSLTFADGTIFSLAPGSRMLLDSLVYDPQGSGNTAGFNLIEGSFVFIAGQVAGSGDMEVKTPTASMGIRGTTVKVDIQTDNGITQVLVSLNTDPDGGKGQIALFDLDGNLIANIDSTDEVWIISPVEGETRSIPRTAEDFADDRALLLEAAQAYQSAFERVQNGGGFAPGDGTAPSLDTGPTGTEDADIPPPVIEIPDTFTPVPNDPGLQGDTPGTDGGTPPPGESDPGQSDPGQTDPGGDGSSGGGLVPIRDIPDNQQLQGLEDQRVEGQVQTGTGNTVTEFALSSGASNGGVVLDKATGAFIYTPDANFFGTDSFTVSVIGENGAVTQQTITLQISDVNDDPILMSDAYSVESGELLAGNVLLNDFDVDGDDLRLVLGPPAAAAGFGRSAGAQTTFRTEAGGLITLDEHGTFTYQPPVGFVGEDSFTYTVTDGTNTYTGTATITVEPPNDAPVATEDTGALVSGTALTGNVLLNDSDPDGDPLRVTAGSLTTAQGGQVSLNSNGEYRYTPAEGFVGTDSFSYILSDGDLTDTATVTLTVSAPNTAPEARDDSAEVVSGESVSGNLLANDTDAEGDALRLTPGVYTTEAGGQISVASTGEYRYTAPEDFAGPDSFTYVVTDGVLSDSATLHLTVLPANQAPDAVDDSARTDVDVPLSGSVTGNDSDPDGDPVFVEPGTFATAGGGTVTLSSDGLFLYTPAPGFLGSDSFVYTLTDGTLTDTATLRITVQEPNTAPEAQNDFETSDGGPVSGNVLSNDSDPDGDPLSVVPGRFDSDAGGRVDLRADGTFVYSPPDGFSGTDRFSYTLTDGDLSDVAIVSIVVSPLSDPETGGGETGGTGGGTGGGTNLPPDAVNDSASGQNTDPEITGNVLTNDSDPDGDPLTVTPQTTTSSNGGTLTLSADGSFSYVPAVGFVGTDVFSYTVSDGTDFSSADLSIFVSGPANTPPDPLDDAATVPVPGSGSFSLNVLANDSDADSDPLSTIADSQTSPDGSSFVIDAAGQVTYSPGPGLTGTESFVYTVSDGVDTATAEVTFTLNSAPDAPSASYEAIDGIPLLEDLSSVASDLDGDALTFTSGTFATSEGGSVTIQPDGSFTYTTPVGGHSGTDSFSYTVSDALQSASGTVSLTISSGLSNTPRSFGGDDMAKAVPLAAAQLAGIGEDAGSLDLSQMLSRTGVDALPDRGLEATSQMTLGDFFDLSQTIPLPQNSRAPGPDALSAGDALPDAEPPQDPGADTSAETAADMAGALSLGNPLSLLVADDAPEPSITH